MQAFLDYVNFLQFAWKELVELLVVGYLVYRVLLI